jgi:Flp pilus assembly protein TadG
MSERSTMACKAPGWLRGQSSVELALVVSLVLVPLLVAIIDGGRMFFTYLQVIEAARAGAQYGSQSLATANDNAGMKTYAANGAPSISGLTTSATNYCCCPGSGSTCTQFGNSTATTNTQSCGVAPPCTDWRRYEQVTATASFSTILRYPGLPSTMNFSSQALFRSR